MHQEHPAAAELPHRADQGCAAAELPHLAGQGFAGVPLTAPPYQEVTLCKGSPFDL
jgi:hypothetical protein